MLKRTIRYLALGATGLSGSMIACGSPSSANTKPITDATVSVDVYDGSGLKVGSCLGTVVSPDTVVTAGHCVAGFSWWQVTSASGQIAHSSIGYTHDWQAFQSNMSHPLHNDVAALKLDTQIHLAEYPALATSSLAPGSAAMRVRPASGGGVEAIGAVVNDGAGLGFRDYYYTSIDASETLETGGALIDPMTNTLYGISSGRGYATGNLYVARVETVASWLSGMASCSAGTSPVHSGGVSTTFKLVGECHSHGPGCDAGAPPPPPVCDGGSSSGSSSGSGSGSGSGSSSGSSSGGSSGGDDSGTTGGGSGSGSSSGSSSGASSSGSTGASSSGGSSSGASSSGGGSGDGGSCSGGGGYCQGSACPSGGGNGTTGSSSSGGGSGSGSGGASSGGSSGGVSSGGNGTTGSSGGGSSGASSGGASSSGASSSGGVSSGGNGTTSSSGGASGGGSGGYNGGSGGPTGGGNGTTGGTGSGGGDNPGCNSSSCGGCDPADPTCSDNTVDFGGVPGAGGGSGSRPY